MKTLKRILAFVLMFISMIYTLVLSVDLCFKMGADFVTSYICAIALFISMVAYLFFNEE